MKTMSNMDAEGGQTPTIKTDIKTDSSDTSTDQSLNMYPGIEIEKNVSSLATQEKIEVLEPGISVEEANKIVEEVTKIEERKDLDVNQMSDEDYQNYNDINYYYY